MGFRGSPTSAGQGLCGFNKGWSLVVKSRVKSLATPCVTELDREVGRENQFFRYNFAKHELAKLLIIYMTKRDHP